MVIQHLCPILNPDMTPRTKEKILHSLLGVVYIFFAETGQATMHQGDIISRAVWKIGRGLLGETCRSEGECFVGQKRGGIRKYRSWKTEVNIWVLPVIKNKRMRSNCVCIFLFPPSFGQKSTPPHSGKPPAVTHIPFFQTACKMISRRCVVAWPVSAKIQLYTTLGLRNLWTAPFVCLQLSSYDVQVSELISM